MVDLLVPLYRLPQEEPKGPGPTVRLAMAYEQHTILRFVRETFRESWSSEARPAFSGHPLRCHIAIADKKVCGFACYDVTFRGFFGPMGVSPAQQGLGVGKRLLLASLHAMRTQGYAYAVIGGVGESKGFYERALDARTIEGSEPGAYEYDLSPEPTTLSAKSQGVPSSS